MYAADPAQLGRVVRSDYGTVERIVEAKDATPEELDGNEINAGLYAFDAEWLRRRIDTLDASGVTGEIYLTELVRLAREDGRIVSAVGFEDDGRFDGINDRAQLAAAEWSLRVRLNEAHMRNGVTMRDPSTVYLDWDVDLASDVTLEPDVILRGATSIGEGSVIGPHSELVDATVGRNVRVWASVVERSTIEDDATRRAVQPPAPRAASSAAGAEVGNYAELKNTTLGAGAKSHHMSYLGDADGRREGQHRRRHDHRQLRRQPASTPRRSATARSSASTRCSSPRSPWARAPAPGAGSVVTRDVPPGKLAVGVPARIREPRPKPTAAEPDKPPR